MNSDIIAILQERFEKHLHRHENVKWEDVEKRLRNSSKLSILEKMESTGGEPDIVDYNTETNEFIFMDCSRESPLSRRSLCYDQVALNARKENKPRDSVINMSNAI